MFFLMVRTLEICSLRKFEICNSVITCSRCAMCHVIVFLCKIVYKTYIKN